eukprot:maker-scaffold280_size224562-snap-gene-1.18 protein:Tk08834 transcript:maker-scaffold280_size224562-snap-gene-1.18-mRNA-1 annotation:"hypothetical protein"
MELYFSKLCLKTLCIALCVSNVLGLSCFQCSEFGGSIKCPGTDNNDPLLWSQGLDKYFALEGNGVSCVVGFSGNTGKIYFQGGVSTVTCKSQTYKSSIINRVHRQPLGTDGTVICCENDGCNWTNATAFGNQDFNVFGSVKSNDGTSVNSITGVSAVTPLSSTVDTQPSANIEGQNTTTLVPNLATTGDTNGVSQNPTTLDPRLTTNGMGQNPTTLDPRLTTNVVSQNPTTSNP